jgi:uncharacterized membrane protein
MVTPQAFALALLVASSLQIMENLLPRFPLFPWMRMGFSYVIILPFLLQFGPRAAFALFLARNSINVLYGGQPLTTFLIGSGSGVVALLGLGHPVAWAYRRGWLGILGASVLLAGGFNLAQLAVVNLALIRHSGFFFQIGPILAWSLVSGAAVALLIRFSEKELADLFSPATPEPLSRATAPPSAATGPFLAGLALLPGLFLFSDLRIQLPALAGMLILARGRGRILWQAWPFFFYLAWLHLFHTSGTYILGEWITREGALRFASYSIRLANLILLGAWLSGRFPWKWIEGSRSPYLQGFLLAVPMLPGLVKPSLEMGGGILRELAAGRRTGVLAPAFGKWRGKMDEAAGRVREP